jgi:hypothetical protein
MVTPINIHTPLLFEFLCSAERGIRGAQVKRNESKAEALIIGTWRLLAL